MIWLSRGRMDNRYFECWTHQPARLGLVFPCALHSKIQSTHNSSSIVRSYVKFTSSKASEFGSLSMIGSARSPLKVTEISFLEIFEDGLYASPPHQETTKLSSTKGNQGFKPSKKPRKPNSKNSSGRESLRIMLVNFQSISNKKADMQILVDQYNPDIIQGTETWLSPNVKTSEILPDSSSYDVFRRESRKGIHGGILIACKKCCYINLYSTKNTTRANAI